MKIRNVTCGVMLLMLLVVGCSKEVIEKQIIRPVKTITVAATSAEVVYNFPGVIKANKDSKLAFRVSGTIESLNFQEGEFVEKDQVIAKIDDRDYLLQVSATKAKYDEVNAEVARVVELYKRNSVSQSDYDKAVAGKAMAEAKYQSALNQLEDTSLLAPFSGYIQNIYFDVHETINKGFPAVSMVDISDLKVETEIPSKTYLKADNFKSFRCHPEEIPELVMPLRMQSIRRKANMNELYKAIFTLKNSPGTRLAPGMIVEVDITIGSSNESTIAVAVGAVFYDSEKTYVWILSNENRVSRQEVVVGNISAQGLIEVISGLTEGDVVVTAGVHTLEENQEVKVINKTSSDNVGDLL